MPVIDPAREDGVGSGAHGRVLLIIGCYLTDVGLYSGKDLVGKLQFREIPDNCNPDSGPGDIEVTGDGSVDVFAMRLRVRDGVDATDERVRCLVGAADERDDCGSDRWTLRAQTYKIEDDT